MAPNAPAFERERLAYSPSSRRRLGETPNRLAERVGGDSARGSPSRLEVAADSVGTRPESTGLRVATGLWEGSSYVLTLRGKGSRARLLKRLYRACTLKAEGWC